MYENSNNKIGKKTVVKCKSSLYEKELLNFLATKNSIPSSNEKEVKINFDNTLTKEEILKFNDADFKLKILNESPILHNFITTVLEKNNSHYINKSLIIYNNDANIQEPEFVEKLILSSNFPNTEVFVNNIENNNNLLSKDKSIELFKDRFKIYARNDSHNRVEDYLSPIFNANTNNNNHNVEISFLKINNLNVIPVIQFPKIFEYIKLHENRELIQFLFKYLLIYDNLKYNENSSFFIDDHHFMTLCLLINEKTNSNGKIEYPLLKQFYEIISNLDSNIPNSKFINIFDPVNKFPQILKLKEYELSSLFSKMDSDFKKEYNSIESKIKNIENAEVKTFVEHFMKISLLIKFIVSQIINVTIQLGCNNYTSSSSNKEGIEIPSLDEFDTIKMILAKILCLKDNYAFSNGKDLTISYNMNSNKKITLNQLKKFSGPKSSSSDKIGNNVGKNGNASTNGKKNSKHNNIEESDEYLDYSFLINWIVPLLNRFFRLPITLPKFYTVEKLSFENFNGIFKNEMFFILLSLSNFKKLSSEIPDIISTLNINDCYIIGDDIEIDALENVNAVSFVNEDKDKIKNFKKISVEDMKKWKHYLVNEYETTKLKNESISEELNQKIDKLDTVRFNKIPNLINGKFDELLDSSTDSIDTAKFVATEVTSTDNKELNTKSKYYKYFQDESSISDDLNVNNLKLVLQKAKDQVSILETRFKGVLEDTEKEVKPEGENEKEIEKLNEKNSKLDSYLITLQEEYKSVSDLAFNKVTQANQLKQLLLHKEKYMKILESEAKTIEQSKNSSSLKKVSVQNENYQSLLQILKLKHEKLLKQEK
ncbi:hypothetical protein ACO0SA_000262 [Hanseniaspora valbyensis]